MENRVNIYATWTVVDPATMDNILALAIADDELYSKVFEGYDSVLKDFFGISYEQYSDYIVRTTLNRAKAYPESKCYGTKHDSMLLQMGSFGVTALVPEWTGEELKKNLIVEPENYLDRIEQSPRTIHDVHPCVIRRIIDGYLEAGETYMEEEGCPEWFNLISFDINELLTVFNTIKDILFAPMKDLIKQWGFTQMGFARTFFIPYQTVLTWCTGRADCKPHLRLMFATALGILPDSIFKKDYVE